MKLNLGAFGTSIEGYMNVDLQKLEGIDIVSGVDKLDFAKDESVESIVASNVLEHFSYYDVDRVMQEWNRVLEVNGTLYLSVPDMEKAAEFICSYGWCTWIERHIYGDQDYAYGQHKCGFSKESIKYLLKRTGFDNIGFVDMFPLEIKGKTASIMRFPDLLNGMENGDYISINLIARKIANIKREVSNG